MANCTVPDGVGAAGAARGVIVAAAAGEVAVELGRLLILQCLYRVE